MISGITTGVHAQYNCGALSPASIASEQTYSRAHTFLRVPHADHAGAGDFAVLGVPLDIATSNRPGARLGPDAVRSASAQLAELKSYPGGFDPLSHVRIVDLGDALLDFGFPHTIPAAIEEAAFNVVSAGAFLCALGGDHFISYPLLKAHARKYGQLALIHFDAHPDTWTPRTGPGGEVEINHGTMFAQAIHDGLIDPSRSSQIGIRTWVDDPMGMNIFDSMAVAAKGPDQIVAMVKALAGDAPCYLTVDIDCLDPAFAPGTGTPVMGGLTPRELLAMLRGLDGLRIVGCDVVEVAPAYDQAGITALAAATVVYEEACRFARMHGARAISYPVPGKSLARNAAQ
ncbi:agmatinase [Hyphomicrobium sp.]|uniref:agmatinase n=1 Tax=Hyphomicrobium sp. TaxID=82 RepID=UPI000F9EA1E4|nr:agmatinase [Hyphomicrobium sp.]RUP10459.1 MAG: agmatinase [Hyphomicrobium sp.]